MGNDLIMNRIREFLGQFISNPDIDPDENLFASGVVNSLFAMRLVMFVEEQFNIQVANKELDLENFRSVNAIVRFIENKYESSAGAGDHVNKT